MKTKLDKAARNHLISLYRSLRATQLHAEFDTHKAALICIGTRLVTAKYGHVQDEMEVLKRYGFAWPIKGFCFTAWHQPDPTDYHWKSPRLCVEHKADILIPDAAAYGFYAGDEKRVSFDIDLRESTNLDDWAACMRIVEWQRSAQATIDTDVLALTAFMAQTTSHAKVMAKYPELDAS